MKEFREGLRQQIIDVSDLKCFWGTAGGMATIYGAMYREIGDGNITNDDREQIADWIRTQRIDCTATFGKPESIDTQFLNAFPIGFVLLGDHRSTIADLILTGC